HTHTPPHIHTFQAFSHTHTCRHIRPSHPHTHKSALLKLTSTKELALTHTHTHTHQTACNTDSNHFADTYTHRETGHHYADSVTSSTKLELFKLHCFLFLYFKSFVSNYFEV